LIYALILLETRITFRVLKSIHGWLSIRKLNMFKFYKQRNAKDCGPACLLMIAGFYGKYYGIEELRNEAGYGKDGVTLLGLNIAATSIGFQCEGVNLNFEQLKTIKMPAILHWNQNHFVVLLAISHKRNKIKIADPAKGIFWISKQAFLENWAQVSEQIGIALRLEPTEDFFRRKIVQPEKVSWRVILNYLKQSKWQVVQVITAFLLVLLFQLIFPFLTQSIVDTGITS
jgi:ATP-binding cassette subfamily B protein